MKRMVWAVMPLAALCLAGCPNLFNREKQLDELRALANGQVLRTEEALEAQSRCAASSADQVACKAVRGTLEADARIFRLIGGAK